MSSNDGRRVAIFGAGPGGLSAALELAERGFEVDLYERNAVGGKARGYRIPGTGADGRADLPGEIGPHVPFGFYASLPDTLRRIPIGDGRTVWDNFAATDESAFHLAWKSDTTLLPNGRSRTNPVSSRDLVQLLRWVHRRMSVRDRALLLSKTAAVLTSGGARHWGQFEHTTVPEYLRTERFSPDARQILEFITAAGIGKLDRMNTRVLARVLLGFASVPLGATATPELFRGAIAPYDEAVFDPWAEHLRALGVRIHLRHKVTALNVDDGRLTGATVETEDGTVTDVRADFYVLAVPPERAATLLAPLGELKSDLAGIGNIEPTWLGGISIYLKESTPALHRAHVCMAQPWKMTVAGYVGLWGTDFAARFGDGSVKDYLSIDIPDWNVPGVLFGKPACELTRDQVAQEVLAQLRRELPEGQRWLAEDRIHSVHVSPSFLGTGDDQLVNDEPLFVNTASSWQYQPDAVTSIPNLLLAAAYVRTDAGHGIDSMDSAVEAGRLAANGILAAVGDPRRAVIPEFITPAVLKPLMRLDDLVYRLGLPNIFDLVAPSAPGPRRAWNENQVLIRMRRRRNRRPVAPSRPVPAPITIREDIECAS